MDNLSGTTPGMWGDPMQVDVIQFPDKVEFVYIETSTFNYTSYPAPPPERRVFKQVFSKDGWSERLYGDIIPAIAEQYDFDEGEVDSP